MSAVQFHCPLCDGLFQVDDSLAGIEVHCPHCAGLVTVPSFDAAPPPPEAAFQLHCPVCMGPFQVTPEMSGQEVNCPHCQRIVTVPDLSQQAEWGPADQGSNYFPPQAERGEDEASPPVETGYQAQVDDLLPPALPGAATNTVASDPWLPPAADETPTPTDVPLPPSSPERRERKPLPAPIPTKPKDTILIPTEKGLVGVHEPVKTVVRRGEEVELRQLTPGEKARRRVVRNTIFVVFCLAVLIGVMVILSRR